MAGREKDTGGGDFGAPTPPPTGVPAGLGSLAEIVAMIRTVRADSNGIPQNDAYSQMPIRQGIVPHYGAGVLPRLPSVSNPSYGAYQNTFGGLMSSFQNDPGTQQTVMSAVSNYYGYEVKNFSQGAGFLRDVIQASTAPGSPSAWQTILYWAQGAGGAASRSNGSGPSGGGAGGVTSRIQLTNPDQAKALLDQTMAQALGRGSTKKERDEFLAALNAAERSNPITQTVDGNAVVVSGGVEPSVQAEEYALSQQGAAEFKAAGELMAAFMSAIEDPVDL